MPFFNKGQKPLTFNQRLDQMGPRYRAVCGQLTRVFAIIEDAASSDPPEMSPARLQAILEMVNQAATELAEAHKETAPRDHAQ
jgi:hypothetical protein